MIIGLSGYARCGKDTLGSFLVEDHGFTQYSFAAALKQCVYVLNPVADVGDTRVQELVDDCGWDEAKKVPEIRRLLQIMGTEVGRQILGDNIWVDTVFNQIARFPEEDVVITDCRFPNEAEAVKKYNGYVVRITRPGVEAVNAHASETALDEWGFDYTVVNDGSLENLQAKAKGLLQGLERYATVATPSRRLPGYGSPTAKAVT